MLCMRVAMWADVLEAGAMYADVKEAASGLVKLTSAMYADVKEAGAMYADVMERPWKRCKEDLHLVKRAGHEKNERDALCPAAAEPGWTLEKWNDMQPVC